MLLALIFDFLDGFVARLLKVPSPMGAQLDSLADMVTFGVLPGMMMYQYLLKISCKSGVCTGLLSSEYFPYLAFIITAYSAWRLAKFNVDDRQSDKFFGIPTPANAAFFATLPYLSDSEVYGSFLLSEPRFVLIVIIGMSFLMVEDVPMIALKFKNFNFIENIFKYLLIGVAFLMLGLFGVAGIPLLILAYILLSIVETYLQKKKEGNNIVE